MKPSFYYKAYPQKNCYRYSSYDNNLPTHFLIWSIIKVLTTLTFFISMVVISITVVTTNFAFIRFWKHCSWLLRLCFMFTRVQSFNVLVNVFRMDPEWRMNKTITTSRYCTSRFVLQKFQWQSTGKYTRGQNFKKVQQKTDKKQTKTLQISLAWVIGL